MILNILKNEFLTTIFKKSLILFSGAFLYAIGLKFFILPNLLFDNGTNGIAVIIYYLYKLPLGLLFIIINIPFWILGYKKINKLYSVLSVISVIFLSIIIEILTVYQEKYNLIFTKDIVLASIFGGVLLGIGVGIIIRNGGALDGIETVSIMLNKRTGFSIGEIAFFINIFIMAAGGFIYGFDKSMYSMVSYFISAKMIDITVEGFDQMKNIMIITDKYQEIATVMMLELGKSVTILQAKGGYSKKEKNIIDIVVSRLEIGKIKKIVSMIDESAFVIITDVHEVMGGRVKTKKNIKTKD